MGCGCNKKNATAENPNDSPPGAVGNPVVLWPGWEQNPARMNGADINPEPIQVWHKGNGAATQLQLKNGLEFSTFGRYDPYDYYLKLLSASADNAGNKGMAQVEPTFHPAAAVQPSYVELQAMLSAGVPNSNQAGGTGTLASPGILTGRTFYG